MNSGAPDGPEPTARRSEGAVLRFLRWLIEPPVGTQPRGVRVLRWLLRALAFLLYAMLAGETTEAGNAGVARKGTKPSDPAACEAGVRRVDRDRP